MLIIHNKFHPQIMIFQLSNLIIVFNKLKLIFYLLFSQSTKYKINQLNNKSH